ncbi:MAG: NAD(P)H-hydrate dehydratase [Lachnospiraceae bacterium]|nr:NAD(P)H-hydrate dehydratase [Lachnospiraceae bacterium]
MQYITDVREAKEIDRITIQEIGIPSMVLMEKAAIAVAGCIKAKAKPESRILSVCGMGNNGGDGVAAARLLHDEGFFVVISLIGNEENASDEMKRQLDIARKLGIYICTGLPEGEYDIIIDAIFGIGLSREVTGEFADAINWINEQDALRFAVDVPSGINASTGEILSVAVAADYTVTFGTSKRGIVLFPGCNYAGEVIVADIGFPKKVIETVSPRAYTLIREDALKMMPKRIVRSNKGSYGKVLVIAGSAQISGACYLSAAAAYRMGCGLVKVFTAEQNGPILKSLLPEALVRTYDSELDYTQSLNRFDITKSLQEEIKWATTIIIGPGIGTAEPAGIMLDEVLKEKNKAIVIDADGLNVLAKKENYFVKREDGTRKICLPENVVLTPHLQEMTRLTRFELPSIRAKIVEQALLSLESTNCQTLVLKDARTVVTDGGEVYINTTGNNALSTGGTGDILSGMIAGLLAQGMRPNKAAVLAVCFHGMAAEEYVRTKGGRYSMMAGDLLDILPQILPK